MEETTIAAISTAMSASGIGIVRISGPEAFEIASGVYRSKGGKKSLKNVPTTPFIMDIFMITKKW